MKSPSPLAPGKQTRHYDNDWLTVLAMLTIFFFHCARFFNFEDWHVKNNQLDEGLTLFVAIVAQWVMPLFFLLKKGRNQELIAGAAAFFGKNGAIFLCGIPIFLTELLVNLQPEGIGIRSFGGWSLFSYLIFFVTGFLLAFDLRYRKAMERLRFISLTLGLLTTGLMFFFPIDLFSLGGFVEYSQTVFCRSFNSWFWLVALLGFGSKFLNFNNEILKYAREAVLPFYILHQTVIVTIGFYIASWETRVMMKYLVLSLVSFAVIMALYDLLVKRIDVLRFLFGMKVKERSA